MFVPCDIQAKERVAVSTCEPFITCGLRLLSTVTYFILR